MRAALCLVFLLAGCLEATETPDPTPSKEQVTPQWITLYLDAEGALVPELGDAASIPIDWGYQQWLDGTPPPAWTGAALGALRILEGNVTLFYQAERPTVSGDVRPELTAWWGSDVSIPHHIFIDGPSSVTAGQVVEATSALRMPGGGLVMAPERLPLLRVGTYYADGPQLSTMDLLVGAETPSRLDLLVEPIAWPEMRSETMLSTTGTLLGSRCAATINPTEEADSYHTISVGPDALGFTVRVQGTDAFPTNDVDLVVYGPNGTDVGGGHSSFDVEGADVWGHNLAVDGPGDYRIRVVACTPQRGAYEMDVTAYYPAR